MVFLVAIDFYLLSGEKYSKTVRKKEPEMQGENDFNDKSDYAKPEKSGVRPRGADGEGRLQVMMYKVFYTKEKNGWRFSKGSQDRRLESIGQLPCGGEIFFLQEDPLAALYEAARGGAKYDPTVDEDRWQVACPDPERETCPGWDCLRKMLRCVAEKKRANQSSTMPAGNENFLYGDANGTRVRNGNGVTGPILGTRDGEINLPEEIVQVARECGKAAQAAENAARANAHGEEVEVCHGGIIAFLKWFFGWKGKR